MNKKNTIKNAAIAGILSLVFLILSKFLFSLTGDTTLISNESSLTSEDLFNIYGNIAFIGGIIAYVFFAWGFKAVGKKTGNTLLTVRAYIAVTFVIFWLMCLVFPSLLKFDFLNFLLIIFSALFSGIFYIFFGKSLLKERENLGLIATITGVLNIIFGASLLSIIFFFIGLLLFIPMFIAEIIFLFKASKVLEESVNKEQVIGGNEQK